MPDPFAYRNADGTLRLDELLGERYVRHYTRILSSSSQEFAAMQLSMAVEAPPEGERGAYSWREPRRGVLTDDGWLLSPEGASDRRASSCTDLAVQPMACWDVCGYYRRIGVSWRATKKEIAQAQLKIDPGRDDEQVSYAVSQLLDPVIRRAYDLVPLGGLFMGDRDVREMIERAAARAASARNAAAHAADPEGYAESMETATDQGRILREWGFDKDGVSAEEARERLGEAFRRGSSSDELGSTLSSWDVNWGWYRMTDPYDEDPWDGARPGAVAEALEQWQAMIARAFSGLGRHAEFAVGIWTGHEPKNWRDSNESCIVFFIGTGQPTQQAARKAVEGYLATGNHRDQQARTGKRGT
jgi:hypothetical protein